MYNRKKFYQGEIVVKMQYGVNFKVLYDTIYENILCKEKRIDHTIYEKIYDTFCNNAVHYISFLFDQNFQHCQNIEEVAEEIKKDFLIWIKENKQK
jgi:hypothetical protein